MEAIGWIGGILLSICGLPEVIRTLQDKKCYVGWGMLITWLIGEICLFAYEFSGPVSYARAFNYLANIAFISIMIYYKRGSK